MLTSILTDDVHQAARTLQRDYRFASICALLLVVGLAANLATWTVVTNLLVRPLPYAADDELVIVETSKGHSFVKVGGRSGFEIPELLAHTRSFKGLAVVEGGGMNLGGPDPERVHAAQVTRNIFGVLGIQTARGRTFANDEEFSRDLTVAIIGEELWRRRFHSSADVIGRVIDLNGKPFTVVGVLSRGVEFPIGTDVWIPAGGDWQLEGVVPTPVILGRLADEITIEQAQADVSRVISLGDRQRGVPKSSTARLIPLRRFIAGDVTPPLIFVTVGSLVMLFVICTNCATMSTARMAVREAEFAIKHAIGASPARLARQIWCESALVTVISVSVAWAGAYALLEILAAVSPPAVARAARLSAVGWSLGITVVFVSIVTTLLSLPAMLFIMKAMAPQSLRADTSAGGVLWRVCRDGLVVGEIAVSVVLVAGAATMIQALAKAMAVDVGVQNSDALVMNLVLPRTVYDSKWKVSVFYARLHASVSSIPGVVAVGATDQLPGNRASRVLARRLEFKESAGLIASGTPAAELRATSDYYKALGINFIAGRTFNSSDSHDPPSAIVSESVGRLVGIESRGILGWHINVAALGASPRYAEVVGVVRDVRLNGPEGDFVPAVYLPYDWDPPRVTQHIVINAARRGAEIVSDIRKASAGVDASLPLYNIRTFGDVTVGHFSARRFALLLILAFGLFTLALGMTGLYGAIAYIVRFRTREIGIRKALGASTGMVMREVMGIGVRMGMYGGILGSVVAIAVSHIAWANWFGVERADVLTLVVVFIGVVIVSGVATWQPAFRAARIDPLVAVREQG